MDNETMVIELKAKVTALQQENDEYQRLLEEKNSVIQGLKDQFEETRREYESVIAEIKEIREQYRQVLDKIQKLKTKYQKDMRLQLKQFDKKK